MRAMAAAEFLPQTPVRLSSFATDKETSLLDIVGLLPLGTPLFYSVLHVPQCFDVYIAEANSTTSTRLCPHPVLGIPFAVVQSPCSEQTMISLLIALWMG